MERRKIIFPPKNKKQKKRSFSRFLFYFTALIFCGAVVYVLFFSLLTQISSIEISGNKNIKSEIILEEINSKLEGKYLGILEKNNLLLLRAGSIRKNLLDKFKQIRDVQTEKKFPSKLIITIQEREIKMAVNDGENNYILDENGQAYDKIDPNSDEARKNNLIFFSDGSRRKINLGDFILKPDFISYILGIRDELKNNLNLETENNFWTPNLISSDIRARTNEGWNIYFNFEVDLKKEMEMLATVLKKEIQESQRRNLEYVDLRADNKVYYKFKQESQEKLDEADIEKTESEKDKEQ